MRLRYLALAGAALFALVVFKPGQASAMTGIQVATGYSGYYEPVRHRYRKYRRYYRPYGYYYRPYRPYRYYRPYGYYPRYYRRPGFSLYFRF